MFEAETIGIAIDRPWLELYAAIWRPEFFQRWASGLSQGGLVADGETWRAEGPDGPIRVRFTPRNDLGVMDHWVELADGRTVSIPLRVVGNGDGALVMLTLFRRPGSSEVEHAADAAWVRRDLEALKALFA